MLFLLKFFWCCYNMSTTVVVILVLSVCRVCVSAWQVWSSRWPCSWPYSWPWSPPGCVSGSVRPPTSLARTSATPSPSGPPSPGPTASASSTTRATQGGSSYHMPSSAQRPCDRRVVYATSHPPHCYSKTNLQTQFGLIHNCSHTKRHTTLLSICSNSIYIWECTCM